MTSMKRCTLLTRKLFFSLTAPQIDEPVSDDDDSVEMSEDGEECPAPPTSSIECKQALEAFVKYCKKNAQVGEKYVATALAMNRERQRQSFLVVLASDWQVGAPFPALSHFLSKCDATSCCAASWYIHVCTGKWLSYPGLAEGFKFGLSAFTKARRINLKCSERTEDSVANNKIMASTTYGTVTRYASPYPIKYVTGKRFVRMRIMVGVLENRFLK
ncbi:hypothetical protein CAPTEDRAFT_217163 [Capitella teleta]|uniref:Uncharacterized protein n=1 Tax=Capitella teleta TaxID=283909 RepID=R7TZY3_CAPTE|nr:hypothetical protein CAPTEDRAFT_217163 [Capitella teleta]|eukprot:ELT96966.1 hypothetical protein CAPTEDRAFT_217163 [Capitella teleta]